MKFRFGGKVALVTGASRGIGEVTASAFASAGAKVALAARSADALEELPGRSGPTAGRLCRYPPNVRDAEAVESMVARTLGTFGRLDIAFNNAAGGGQPPTRIAELPVDS